MSTPGDEDTHPNLQRYLKAEGRFDRLMAPIVASPLTLALFLIWTMACLAFGFWCGLKP